MPKTRAGRLVLYWLAAIGLLNMLGMAAYLLDAVMNRM